jgi:uncharacterized protein YbaP (TraB family)
MRPPSRIVACVAGSGVILFAVAGLPAAEAASNAKHCLWRVTNAKAPFYLFGSVHALQRSDYDQAPAVAEVIKHSQLILFEVDPKEDQIFAKKLAEAARLPRGQQIRGKISPKTYDYLRKITINGMAEWQHLYPWAIAMLLDYPQLRGVSSIYGVDNHVAEMARRYSKRTGGVERSMNISVSFPTCT